jgi:pimeloyl-ACP methyl ester carboxylesterase
MPRVRSNGIDLEYDTIGDAVDPALVLIMGLGAQLPDWPDEFCQSLAARGFHVIRFDNRDAGLSTELADLGTPDFAALLAGERFTPPYLLADLADDTAGLLDALGIAKAHIVGASMGGMIAQQFVIDHTDRVRSLCSIMSTTGDPSVGQQSPEAMAVLGRPPVTSREEAVEATVQSARIISSPGFPFDEDELRERAAARYDRSYRPAGTLRQTVAIVASPDRTAGLRKVSVPTVVIHGEADPLIDVSGGRATAAAVEGSELLLIPGMGHDLPREVWARIVDAIVDNAEKAADVDSAAPPRN